jgi:hypothetical protein
MYELNTMYELKFLLNERGVKLSLKRRELLNLGV